LKRLAIIPARGGSKRIQNKNIRNFCGQPMISHILGATQKSELFSKIHVSTESLEIQKVVSSIGFTPDFLRDPLLSDDYTPIMPVLRYVTQRYIDLGEKFDEVWLLMACAPLIEANDLCEAAAEYLRSGRRRPMVAITEYPAPIEWALRKSVNGIYEPVMPGMFAVRSQDLSKNYYDSGSFAIFTSQYILDSVGPGSDDGFEGFILNKAKAVDIDNEDDWSFAEKLFYAAHNL